MYAVIWGVVTLIFFVGLGAGIRWVTTSRPKPSFNASTSGGTGAWIAGVGATISFEVPQRGIRGIEEDGASPPKARLGDDDDWIIYGPIGNFDFEARFSLSSDDSDDYHDWH